MLHEVSLILLFYVLKAPTVVYKIFEDLQQDVDFARRELSPGKQCQTLAALGRQSGGRRLFPKSTPCGGEK